MSSMGLKSRIELFLDAAFGNRQYESNYHGYDRQVGRSHRDKCITPSPVLKNSLNENSNTTLNGANSLGSKGSDGDGRNRAESGGGRPTEAGGSQSVSGQSRHSSSDTGSNGGDTYKAPGGGNTKEREDISNSLPLSNTKTTSSSKLHALVQHIYAAQARVQLEVIEIKKAQAVASAAQKSLEEASNNVRVITAALQTAQQEAAAAAVRARTAQLQLAAHDQLLFAARQKVDALSAQMVGLQVEEGIILPHSAVDVKSLFDKLKEPLSKSQTPTPIPPIDNPPKLDDFGVGNSKKGGAKDIESKRLMDYEDYY